MFELDQEFKALSQKYVKRVKYRIANLLDNTKQLDNLDYECLIDIRDEAHRLKGSGLGYGFYAISHLAERVEIECNRLLKGNFEDNGKRDFRAPLFQIKRNLEELFSFCETVEKEFEAEKWVKS